jgi:hypothetical protein
VCRNLAPSDRGKGRMGRLGCWSFHGPRWIGPKLLFCLRLGIKSWQKRLIYGCFYCISAMSNWFQSNSILIIWSEKSETGFSCSEYSPLILQKSQNSGKIPTCLD